MQWAAYRILDSNSRLKYKPTQAQSCFLLYINAMLKGTTQPEGVREQGAEQEDIRAYEGESTRMKTVAQWKPS
jgi:hypothetical protein